MEQTNSKLSFEEKIAQYEDTYDNKLDELQDELSKCFTIDEFSLVNENIKTVSNLHLWITRLATEQRFLIKLRRKKDTIYSNLYREYRTGEKGQLDRTKDGIDCWINKEPEYQKINTLFEEQKVIVDYIDQICWALKQTKMAALKNIQEAKKLELG